MRPTVLDGMSHLSYDERTEFRKRATACLDTLSEQCPALADDPPRIVFKEWYCGGEHNHGINRIIISNHLTLPRATYILGHEMRHAFQHAIGWLRIFPVRGTRDYGRSWTTRARQVLMMHTPRQGPEYDDLPWEKDAMIFGLKWAMRYGPGECEDLERYLGEKRYERLKNAVENVPEASHISNPLIVNDLQKFRGD